jgi:cation transport ATPase
MNTHSFFSNVRGDLAAGLVVFLVALPLCLGIALASGAPLFSGIISGVMGTETAMEAADIVLMQDKLEKIAKARAISKRAFRTIKENIFVGVGVVHVIGITLVLLKVIGPIEAAAIHLLPDTLVFINSIKLLRVKI